MSAFAMNFASATGSPHDDWTDGLGARNAETRCGEKTDGQSNNSEVAGAEYEGYGGLGAPTVLKAIAGPVEGSVEETSCPVESGAKVTSPKKSPQKTNAPMPTSPATVRPIVKPSKPWKSQQGTKEAPLAGAGENKGQSPASRGGHWNTPLVPQGNYNTPGKSHRVPRGNLI